MARKEGGQAKGNPTITSAQTFHSLGPQRSLAFSQNSMLWANTFVILSDKVSVLSKSKPRHLCYRGSWYSIKSNKGMDVGGDSLSRPLGVLDIQTLGPSVIVHTLSQTHTYIHTQ